MPNDFFSASPSVEATFQTQVKKNLVTSEITNIVGYLETLQAVVSPKDRQSLQQVIRTVKGLGNTLHTCLETHLLQETILKQAILGDFHEHREDRDPH